MLTIILNGDHQELNTTIQERLVLFFKLFISAYNALHYNYRPRNKFYCWNLCLT